MNREDCFANAGNKCSALSEKNCKNCKFYRNDLKRADIERDIRCYQKGGNYGKKI